MEYRAKSPDDSHDTASIGNIGRSDDRSRAIKLDAILSDVILPVLSGIVRPCSLERPPPHAPLGGKVAELSAGLITGNAADLDAWIASMADDRRPLLPLLTDCLAPAARELGRMWEEDVCDFLSVTEAIGRLQVVTRRLCAERERSVPQSGRSLLLTTCPGETHVYGLSLVGAVFREAGWTVHVCDWTGADPVARIAREPYDVVGLSLSRDLLLPSLKATIPKLRRASRNPDLRVLVGGSWFARSGAGAGAVGADACIEDVMSAPAAAEDSLERIGAGPVFTGFARTAEGCAAARL